LENGVLPTVNVLTFGLESEFSGLRCEPDGGGHCCLSSSLLPSASRKALQTSFVVTCWVFFPLISAWLHLALLLLQRHSSSQDPAPLTWFPANRHPPLWTEGDYHRHVERGLFILSPLVSLQSSLNPPVDEGFHLLAFLLRFVLLPPALAHRWGDVSQPK